MLDQLEKTLRMRNWGVIIDVRCQKKMFNKFGLKDVEWDGQVLTTEWKYVQVKSMYPRVDSKFGSLG